MSIIQDLESLKYRFVLDLFKNNEQYDKKKSVLTALETFNLCYNRYLLLQQILTPLKEKLGGEIDITDISFINGMQGEMSFLVKYLKDGKQYQLSISGLDFQDINILSSDLKIQNSNFIEANRGIILRTFKKLDEESLNNEIVVKSTSGKFVVGDNSDVFSIKNVDGRLFSLKNKYSIYDKTKSLSSSNLECNFPKLKELIMKDGNILALYQHIHVYEDSLPRELIKKIN